ncbi:MAG: P-loop NTPase [Pseudoclavibacter sp.]
MMSDRAAPSVATTIDPALRDALAQVTDPELHAGIVDLGMIGAARIEDGTAHVQLRLTIPGCPAARRLEAETRAACEQVVGAGRVDLRVTVMDADERARLVARLRGTRPLPGTPFSPGTATKVLAVASGKGGVGKSTVTANLAAALAAGGAAVGVVDADVYGYSIPGMFGITTGPTRLDDMLLPPTAHGVRVMSIGMFVPGNQPVSWRGPMLARTLTQFLTDVHFGELDYLLIDLPPGTGDTAITLGQLLPNAHVLIITTPQSTAAQVAVRAGLLAHRMHQRLAGVVENMSWIETPGGSFELFGTGGGEQVAAELTAATGMTVPLLARIPLTRPLREASDDGAPIVVSDPTDPAAQALRAVAAAVAPRGGRHLGARPPRT